jgi:hypothetical protein
MPFSWAIPFAFGGMNIVHGWRICDEAVVVTLKISPMEKP